MKKLCICLLVISLLMGYTGMTSIFAAETPIVSGDSSRLTIEKTSFAFDEPITVSAIGSGKDWVGIYSPGATTSLRWEYVEVIGSGVSFDLKTDTIKKPSTPEVLPAGEYVIRLMPDDTSDISRAIAWVTVTINPKTAPKAEAPQSVEYVLKNDTDGYAAGRLTVKISAGNSATDMVAFWADDIGKLSGYTSLAMHKLTGQTTTIDIPDHTIIPPGATRLLVYTVNSAGDLSDNYTAVTLPAGAARSDFGKPIVEFQVVSDIHLNSSATHTYNKNFVRMLEDVSENSPDSIGIFAVGDITDHGYASEYEQLQSIYEDIDDLPPFFMAIGNHDLYNGTYQNQSNLFLENALMPDDENPESLHYDFFLNGYHFVFLGNDASPVNGVRTTLLDSTIEWLEDTLETDYEEGKPIFLFLHQSLYDTVAGSLPGQGWNGVVEEDGLREVLADFPEVILFNGHSHWTLDSERNMYAPSEDLPAIFNTASVAYLWTSYNVITGENLVGSQGYFIRVYQNEVVVLGRDFTSGEWIPSAMYALHYEGEEDTTNNPPISDSTSTTDNGSINSPGQTNAPSQSDPQNDEIKPGSSPVGIIVAPAATATVLTVSAVTFVLIKKKKR